MKTIRNILISTAYFLVVTNETYAQHENDHWLFGSHNSVHFISDTLEFSSDNSIYADECSSSISDSLGNLLFYTDGVKIWDKNHSTMPNGNGLTATGDVQQGVLIVPKPNSSQYYVFTIGLNGQGGYDKDIHYSIVDMSLNNGLGAVIEKNVFLGTDVTEKLSGTLHSNKKDFWVVFQHYRTNIFKAYLIDDNGLSNSPVISNVGLIPSHVPGSSNFTGSIKFSPSSEWLSCSNRSGPGVLELFHFNNETGILTGYQHIEVRNIYGMEFSSDNSKLYVGNNSGSTQLRPILQFDLSLGSDSLILTSPVQVSDPVASYEFHLAPDCKIYFRGPNVGRLGVIHYPNSLGAACEIDPLYFGINLGFVTGLPNQIKYSNRNGETCYGPSSIATVVDELNIKVYPNPTNDGVRIEFQTIPENVIINSYDMQGRLIRSEMNSVSGPIWHQLPDENAIYLIQVVVANGKVSNFKVVKE